MLDHVTVPLPPPTAVTGRAPPTRPTTPRPWFAAWCGVPVCEPADVELLDADRLDDRLLPTFLALLTDPWVWWSA